MDGMGWDRPVRFIRCECGSCNGAPETRGSQACPRRRSTTMRRFCAPTSPPTAPRCFRAAPASRQEKSTAVGAAILILYVAHIKRYEVCTRYCIVVQHGLDWISTRAAVGARSFLTSRHLTAPPDPALHHRFLTRLAADSGTELCQTVASTHQGSLSPRVSPLSPSDGLTHAGAVRCVTLRRSCACAAVQSMY